MRGGTLTSVPPRNKPNDAPKRLIPPFNTKRGAPVRARRAYYVVNQNCA